jgi:hypothetical protein
MVVGEGIFRFYSFHPVILDDVYGFWVLSNSYTSCHRNLYVCSYGTEHELPDVFHLMTYGTIFSPATTAKKASARYDPA